MKAFLLLALLAARPVSAPDTTVYNTSGIVREADPVERRIFATGVRPDDFWFSFKTTYRLNGQEVTAKVFWRSPLVGKHMQVKATARSGFWFVTAVNIKEKL